MIKLLKKHSATAYKNDIGKVFTILIEQDSKRSADHWSGRNSQNKMVVFPKNNSSLKPGEYAEVKITNATSGTLMGKMIA